MTCCQGRLGAVAAGVLGALLLAACSGGEPAGAPPATATRAGGGAGQKGEGGGAGAGVAVIAHDVQLIEESLRVEAVGTSRARRSAVIYPETGGEVEAVLFETGDYVEAGTPLLRLESQREALAVRLARVEVDNAELVLSRYRRIEDSGAVPVNQVDEAQTALEAARIALDQAEVALVERTVRAPFSGHLGLTDVDAGARITATTAITQLDDRRSLFIDFAAPEEVFRHIGEGDSVSVVPFSNPDSTARATVVGVDSRIDMASRSFTVRAQLDNEADRLRPGMSFRVLFAMAGERYPGVPENALLWGSDGPYVWRIAGDLVRRADVEIVSREGGYVLVRGDLEGGARIVLEGIQKVREGSRVRVVGVDGPGARPITAGEPATRGVGR